MEKKIVGQFEPKAGTRILIIALFMTICITWLYRQQLMNGFTILAGDRYDGLISTTILEHWYNVVRGKANWSEVDYFFPHVRTLANTDGYFIIGVIYAPFRMLGLDPFTAAELANMVVKGIGFLGIYWMCRRVFSLPFHWAVLAAILFTLSNGMTTHSSRSQLSTIAIAPWMVVLLWKAFKGAAQNDFGQFRRFGSYAGLLFGAWCLSGFYAAWFFVYFTIVLSVIALLSSGKRGLAFIAQQARQHIGSYLLVLAVALLALAPFVYAFLPKSQETGVRNYSEALAFTVLPENILQLGPENFFVGKAYNAALLKLDPGYLPANEYYNTGIGIFLFILFVFAAVRIFRHDRKSDKLIFSFMLATIVTWVTTLNFGGFSLWYAVFHVIPGAKAMRVVSTCQIFLALPIILIAVRYLSMLRLPVTVAVLLAALLITEELNTPTQTLNLTKSTEMARIALPNAPPAQCKVFYTSGWKEQSTLPGPAAQLYAHNVTAMMIAQKTGLPTLNGFASFMAPDWDFGYPNKPDYDVRVRSYASRNDVKNLCRLDLNDKTWTVVDPATIRAIAVDVPFFEKSQWDGGLAGFTGLSAQEAWGRWSDAKVVKFEFTRPLPPKFALHLTAHAYASNSGKDFVVMLHDATSDAETPAGNVQKFSMPEADVERVLHFDNPLGLRRIHIVVPEPISPRKAHGAEDDRELGIGVVKLRIEPL